jgi:uncharacterized repeat protein (TIGR01451 family)
MLNQAQKVSLRRHMGVPFAGTAQAGRLFGWRFAITFEDLEFKMNNMTPPEEQLLTGYSMGSFSLRGVPTVGETITYLVTDPNAGVLTATYTVQPSDMTFIPPGSSQTAPDFSVALNSALRINAAMGMYGYAGVGVQPADLISVPFLPPYFSELMITGPTTAAFPMAVSTTGTLNTTVEYPGKPSPAQATIGPAGSQTTFFGYLNLCDYLAMQPAQARLSLRYMEADVVKFRRDEVAAQAQLYKYFCSQMGDVIGGKEYIRHFSRGGGGGSVA